jgi:hypothetical protein
MNNRKGLIAALTVLLGAWLPSAPAWAQHSQDFGDYVVYFDAFTTDFLAPQMAKHYGITRSKNRGLLNIVVQKKVLNSPAQPVAAKVTAQAVNLHGQLKKLDVREVREGTAIYYLSDFRVTDQETLDFTVDVTPTGETASHPVKFRQQFFTQ